MKNLFEKYQIIKKDLKYSYKGYPIENILAYDIIRVIYKQRIFSSREFAKIFMTKRIVFKTKKKVLFSMGSYNRTDFYNILTFVRRNIESDLIDLSQIKRSFKFSLKNIFISCKHLFLNGKKLSFIEKLSLFTSMTYTLNIIDDLEKNNLINIEIFCSFCSNLNEESILDYFFQKKNIDTYTLQHALYFIFDSFPIHLIAYENIVADKLLCWGEYTKDEFMKFGVSSDKLLCSGYPKKVTKLLAKETIQNKILILFSHIDNHKNNLKLIGILKDLQQEMNFDIEFKLHPSLDYNLYSQIAVENGFNIINNKIVHELIQENNYLFSIVYNSTTYYESYINNCISLRFKDKDAHNSVDVWDDGFFDVEELKKKIEFFTNKNKDETFWNETEKKLEYILGYGVNNYKELLDVN